MLGNRRGSDMSLLKGPTMLLQAQVQWHPSLPNVCAETFQHKGCCIRLPFFWTPWLDPWDRTTPASGSWKGETLGCPAWSSSNTRCHMVSGITNQLPHIKQQSSTDNSSPPSVEGWNSSPSKLCHPSSLLLVDTLRLGLPVATTDWRNQHCPSQCLGGRQ